MMNFLLVEDHPILRIGLKVVIEQTLDAKIKGEAGDGKQAVKLVEHQPFDLVLMDINMPEMSGLECAKIIKQKRPKQKILIYSATEDNHIIAKTISLGVEGYLFKSDDANELKRAIEMVVQDKNYLSKRIAENFIPFLIKRAEAQPEHVECELSSLEINILIFSLEGKVPQEIGRLLSLTPHKITTISSALMDKLNCSSLTQLFKYAIRRKLV